MIYGYIRVSSDKQTVENQRFEINNFCRRENITIDGWIEETISGTKAYNKRQLGSLLKRIRKDDLIICAELSRLGRNLFMIVDAPRRLSPANVPKALSSADRRAGAARQTNTSSAERKPLSENS